MEHKGQGQSKKQHRPQTVSKPCVGTNIKQKIIWVRPIPSPQEQIDSSMIFVGVDLANCSATREEKGGQDPVTELGHRVQGRGQSVCPGLVSAARGQERTTAGQCALAFCQVWLRSNVPWIFGGSGCLACLNSKPCCLADAFHGQRGAALIDSCLWQI